jgi:hypothetical protein
VPSFPNRDPFQSTRLNRGDDTQLTRAFEDADFGRTRHRRDAREIPAGCREIPRLGLNLLAPSLTTSIRQRTVSPTIQRMRTRRLNCALAAIVIVATAACSRPTGQAEKTAARALTFNRDVAPILFDNCASCHRPIDGAAPRPGRPTASPLRPQGRPMIRSA